MQEDKFLDDYKQTWQQDNEEMTRIVDIPLETLHKNIARYERMKTYPGLTATPLKRGRRSRRIVWTTLSAAACLAFAVTTGIRYLTPAQTTDNPVLVAENRVEVPNTFTYPPASRYPSQEGTGRSRTKNTPADAVNDSQFSKPNSLLESEDVTGAAAVPSLEGCREVAGYVPERDHDSGGVYLQDSQFPKDANVIETSRLVAMGETQTPAVEVETEGLVKIVSPSRNTFHEAVVEPLLALVTFDM